MAYHIHKIKKKKKGDNGNKWLKGWYSFEKKASKNPFL
jgi:hypothetical protein